MSKAQFRRALDQAGLTAPAKGAPPSDLFTLKEVEVLSRRYEVKGGGKGDDIEVNYSKLCDQIEKVGALTDKRRRDAPQGGQESKSYPTIISYYSMASLIPAQPLHLSFCLLLLRLRCRSLGKTCTFFRSQIACKLNWFRRYTYL